MEKNKQDLQQDTFLKKYVQEIELDTPKSNFTNAIMDVLLAEEKKTVLKSEPLISKKMWFLSLVFIVTCIWFLLKGNSTYRFPTLELSFINKIQMPNLLESISISKTMLYAVIIFSLMVFIQVLYLKNHFNKRFN